MTLALGALDLLLTDHHVHSTWSDDAVSAPRENLVAARDTGLASIRMVDHVRTTTTWVPGFLAEVAALPRIDGLEVLTGVEAKILDASGRLDVPDDLVVGPGGVDRILLDILVTATVRAMERVGRGQLAHLFSLLPKIGLHESALCDDHLAAIANAAVRTGTAVEVNEKWRCPGPRAVLALAAAGVPLVGSTDSHECSTVGRYSWVSDAASATRLVGVR
ncbi:histidinol-phosphatase [Blastococcus saxobsidens]|uniref:Putative hydrolase n=1 Tax=Blastococcus saxobsidens (strain DD2) TaxID=1146883 RepID=H6RW56_BLASD|nr:histidinol-phosphatase [Blastococcus saxobsidens]CCG02073.1 Putative hydrolase [Blastococcus saxobsidens DD2]